MNLTKSDIAALAKGSASTDIRKKAKEVFGTQPDIAYAANNPYWFVQEVDVFLDFGNGFWKLVSRIGKEAVVSSLPHVVADITASEFKAFAENATRSNDLSVGGYFNVDGNYVCIGHTANSHRVVRLVGHQRYTPGYYGAAALSFISMFLKKNYGTNRLFKINLFESYAPRDGDFVPNIQQAIGGAHRVTDLAGDEMYIHVAKVGCIEEPSCGLMAYMRDNRRDVKDETVFVCDLGTGTCDLSESKLGSDGRYYRVNAISYSQGIQQLREGVFAFLRKDNPRSYTGDMKNHISEIDDIIRTGKFVTSGGKTRDYSAKVDELLTVFFNELYARILAEIGSLSRGLVVLTGGGADIMIDNFREYDTETQYVLALSKDNIKRYGMFAANVYGMEWITHEIT